ncbi:alpha-ketoglutarate-dependent taurine dioxygenase [Paenibacillus phyllosphaerae]|uniref:Alpha-ketoglutarate-dependent taurine dioxygenase n=1 Tax=Paenibacillus phyllosphaerae TaxID=274593 RepID=A0A7W5ATQ0_9BACL|nr:TauD/TfdA family dioxygenase [Paenibacillus phyllosphaerae]MBB3107976.1 alpha-ketoglutarate-dependent taurine dioxygenase [Paenibacillus phyllosphaerae]
MTMNVSGMEPTLSNAARTLPVIISSDNTEDIIAYAQRNRSKIESHLLHEGGILFRGFPVDSIEKFEEFTAVFSEKLEAYNERSTPRSEVQGKVYTSTEYPSDQHIPMHNENSYSHQWPRLIWFHCVTNAEVGGETPIADSRVIYNHLDPAIIARFREKKVMYVRNLGGKIDLPWQTVFQSDDKAYVEAYCAKAGLQLEWLGEDRVRTKAVREAVARHPETGEMLWFNQAHLFHYTSLPEDIRDFMLSYLKEENLPRNVFYGDGSPIEESILDEIRKVYDQHTVKLPWQEGDVMMLDNMLIGHAREPYKGKRKIVVAMANVYNNYGLDR